LNPLQALRVDDKYEKSAATTLRMDRRGLGENCAAIQVEYY
jgi:hypothetical protein